MTDGQPEPRTGRVRFTGTADIERLLADAPGIRAALLEEGAPARAFSVTADTELAVLRTNGRRYIRFATAGNGDPVAVELPSGRVVELVTRRYPPPETTVNVALYSTSLTKFCEVREAFHATISRLEATNESLRERVGDLQRLSLRAIVTAWIGTVLVAFGVNILTAGSRNGLGIALILAGAALEALAYYIGTASQSRRSQE